MCCIILRSAVPSKASSAHVTRRVNADQPRHRDSYFGYQKMRSLNTWEVMIFYFPHDVTEVMGPTVVVPRRCTRSTAARCQGRSPEVKQSLKAGDFYLVHYNLWHRGSANLSDTFRVMVKFQFIRTRPPASPSWAHNPSDGVTLRHVLFIPPPSRHAVPSCWTAMWFRRVCRELGFGFTYTLDIF